MLLGQALRSLTLLVLIGPGLLLSPANAASKTSKPTPTDLSSIDAVVSEVKLALADVQTSLASSGLPPLKQVEISLQTTATKKGGVTLKLWVINFGGTYEKDKVQLVDIILTPPVAGEAKATGSASLTQELEEAIISAAQGVATAGTGTIPLKFTSLKVQLAFTVKGDLSGGASITIVPITADFTGDLSKTAVQTLTVTFAAPGAGGSSNSTNP